MIIQINTDNHVVGDAAMTERVSAIFTESLSRFADNITRIEAHFSDEDGELRTGLESQRCLLEARLAGEVPIAVSDRSDSVEASARGAVGKLVRLLESAADKKRPY